MSEYTDESLDRIAAAATDMILARLDGDTDGARAAEAQAQTIRDNPRSRK